MDVKISSRVTLRTNGSERLDHLGSPGHLHLFRRFWPSGPSMQFRPMPSTFRCFQGCLICSTSLGPFPGRLRAFQLGLWMTMFALPVVLFLSVQRDHFWAWHPHQATQIYVVRNLSTRILFQVDCVRILQRDLGRQTSTPRYCLPGSLAEALSRLRGSRQSPPGGSCAGSAVVQQNPVAQHFADPGALLVPKAP